MKDGRSGGKLPAKETRNAYMGLGSQEVDEKAKWETKIEYNSGDLTAQLITGKVLGR